MSIKNLVISGGAFIAAALSLVWWNHCKDSRPKNENRKRIETCVNRLVGSILELPTNVGSFTTNGDSVNSVFPAEYFKIVRYVGKNGCTSCRLHLSSYPQLLADLSELADFPVGFVCIINPADINEVRRILHRENFSGLTMWIDQADTLNRINHFPEIDALQTFLLDGENRVLAVGDPAVNPRVMRLFADILSSDSIKGSAPAALTELVADPTEKMIGRVSVGDTARCEFRITNCGDEPFVLDRVVTSCDCTTAQLSADTIPAGESATLQVRFSESDPVGDFIRTISIFGNLKNELVVEISGECYGTRK